MICNTVDARVADRYAIASDGKLPVTTGVSATRTGAVQRQRSNLQARQQIPALLGTWWIAQHVVAARDELHRRTEISCAARHRIRDRRGDQAEENTGDQTSDQRAPRACSLA